MVRSAGHLLKLVPRAEVTGRPSAGLLADTTLGDPFASDLGPAPVGSPPGTLPSSSSGTDLDSGALHSAGLDNGIRACPGGPLGRR